MRTRPARRLPTAVAVAAAVTGTLTWAPTATAQDPKPTSSTSTASTRIPESGAGSVAITKDPAGESLEGATFPLFDATGQEVGSARPMPKGSRPSPISSPASTG